MPLIEFNGAYIGQITHQLTQLCFICTSGKFIFCLPLDISSQNSTGCEEVSMAMEQRTQQIVRV